MRTKCFFSVLLASLSLLVSLCLSSCTESESYVEVSSTPINLDVLFDIKDVEIPAVAFTLDSPVKVIGFKQECQSNSMVFVDEAYINANGVLTFINNSHYWLSDRNMSFTVYWPADAVVTMDNFGKITSGNCVVAGCTMSINPILPRKDSSVNHDENRIILRKYINRN